MDRIDGHALWKSTANRPFAEVSLPEEYRQKLSAAFFFEPSPKITRVIAIATPYRGSLYARRIVGRIGARLVDVGEEERKKHPNAVRSNPDVFSEEVRQRVPTSIDLLELENCLLKAIDRLPLAEGVTAHAVAGISHWRPWTGASDGVVAVNSTHLPDAISELHGDARHTDVHEHPAVVDEVMRILLDHLDP